MGTANPFRSSTKYQDDETDLLYYGYRYYDASTGRWISTDPIGERGGKNLQCFGRNSPINSYDILGKKDSNERWFSYEGATLSITPSMDGNNFCSGGALTAKVSFDVNNDDPGGNYMMGTHFGFNGSDQPYEGFNGGPPRTTFFVSLTFRLPNCPNGSVGGSETFSAGHEDQDVSALIIRFNWAYSCNACCELDKPLSVSYDWTTNPPLFPRR
jgi:RHS repeat-associated protein